MYLFIYPQAAWFAVAVIDNVVVGLGWSAITFQEAVLSHCVVRVGWLSIGAVVTIHFQGSVATLMLDRYSCYIDARLLLRCQEGVAALVLDLCCIFREGLLR